MVEHARERNAAGFGTWLSVAAVFLACGGALAQKKPSAADASDLAAAVRRAGQRLNAGDPRPAIVEELEAAIAAVATDRFNTGEAERDEEAADLLAARKLAADLRAAIEIEGHLPEYCADAPIDDLARGLIDSRLPYSAPWSVLFDTLVVVPGLVRDGEQRWHQHSAGSEFDGMDPAYRLYKRGREAIPALIELLDDSTATRALLRSQQELPDPPVVRRQDIAVGVIEAISLCRFHRLNRRNRAPDESLTPFHALTEAARRAVIANIREWWKQSRDLSPFDATSWWIDRAPPEDRMEMISALQTLGEQDRAVRHLRLLAEQGPREFAAAATLQLVQLSDPVTLERVRTALEAERNIDGQLLNVLVRAGGAAEYEALRRVVAAEIDADPQGSPEMVHQIISNVQALSEPKAIPLLVEALRSTACVRQQYDASTNKTRMVSIADIAAEALQRLVSKDFGYRISDAIADRTAAIARMSQWWETEGRAQFSLPAREARRRGGIR